jgi:hypothetical protein
MNVAYVTAGTVGAGHLVRGLAIGRGLVRAGFSGSYRMFGPPLPFAPARRSGSYEAVAVEAERSALERPDLAPASSLARRLAAFQPDLVLVDLFWAPLRWVLPTLDAEAWLLVRTCPAIWLTGTAAMPFEPDRYRRILGVEPVAYPALGGSVEPIVICNPDECQPPGALRERLGMAAAAELAVLVHAGEPGEMTALRQAAAGHECADLDLFADEPLFPAAAWLGGADRIFCGAGYNAFWEARWLGYADRTCCVPFRRSIDDQAARLASFRDRVPRANGADQLARSILNG